MLRFWSSCLIQNKILVKNVSAVNVCRTLSNQQQNVPASQADSGEKSRYDLSSEDVNKRLMTFFDVPENWKKENVTSGRNWRIEELRIKSNSDLHKLWYILYIERNMLMTMQEVSTEKTKNMPSPERLDKVEESMKYIEEVVKERNRAYFELEVGDGDLVTRRKAFRKDIFGRWRWIACSEHLIPYWMNSEWRKFNAPGFGSDVIDFNRRLNEKKQKKMAYIVYQQAFHCRQLMLRFDSLDLDYLQEKFPDVDVKYMKENLYEITRSDRFSRFHKIFYAKKLNDMVEEK